jgi:hypothetical protein
MLKALSSALLLRRLVKELGGIRVALESQGAALLRIAEKLDPTLPLDKLTLRADTGVDHLDSNDAYLAQEYVARTHRDTGHIPDEDEILIYLADEKTVDLHKRLVEREDQLARLAAARQ